MAELPAREAWVDGPWAQPDRVSAIPTPRSHAGLLCVYLPANTESRAHCSSVGLNSWEHFYVFMMLYLETSK